MDVLPSLAYTIAIDPPGFGGHRTMAKMLALSLVRTLFTGDFLIFRNTREPIFLVERKGIEEVYIETPALSAMDNAEEAWCWKYRVYEYINRWLQRKSYDKVLFLDADCLALRNVDHLLHGKWDIAYQPEVGINIDAVQFSCFLTDDERKTLRRAGINSGTIAVAASHYVAVMKEWERIDLGKTTMRRFCSDQGSWNRLILDCQTRLNWRAHKFERDGIMFPMYIQPRAQDYTDATLVHCLGGSGRLKIKFMFGLYMSTFFCDDAATFLHLLEM